LKRTVIIVGVAIAVIAWLGVGLVVAKGPQPEIVVPAESLWKVGPLHITNTLFTAWVVMALLIVLSFAATKSMKLMPSGIQNFVEAVVGFLLGQVEDIAGEKNGRRFFMVVATIFLFVITSNWFGLLPFFNAIGQTDDVGHEIYKELSEANPSKLKLKDGAYTEDAKFAGWKMEDSGGVVMAKSGTEQVEFEVFKGDTPGKALDRYAVFLAHSYVGDKTLQATIKSTEEERKALSDELVRNSYVALKQDPSAPKLLTAAPPEGAGGVSEATVTSPVTGEAVYGVDFENSKKLALVVPFFRGVYSDVNNTLALGIIAFFCIEFWGFQALGFGYLKKFFNFSSPIAAIVGLLELLSEFIRIISFTFRLFGNIFAGEILVLMLTFLMPFLFVDIIYGLELFVGLIQASVFALLTLVFASMAVEHHGEGEHHEGHQDEDASADAHHHAGTAQAH